MSITITKVKNSNRTIQFILNLFVTFTFPFDLNFSVQKTINRFHHLHLSLYAECIGYVISVAVRAEGGG
jgi:predicted membrane protein